MESFDPDVIDDMVRAQYLEFEELGGAGLVSGNQYSTGKFTQNLADAATVSFVLKNPADSETYLFVDPSYSVTGEFITFKALNVTVDTDGTTENIICRRCDGGSDGIAIAESNPVVTIPDGNAFTKKPIGSGKTSKVSGANVATPEVVIPPGSNAYFEAENVSGADLDISIDVDFTEIPAGLVESIQQSVETTNG